MTPRIARKVINMYKQLKTPVEDYGLSEREKEVLQRLSEGGTREQIADQLFVAPTTVAAHLKNIYMKLHVHSASEAVAKAIRERVIS